MNILLIFFALPIATIIISIALQKILKCPSLVAAIIFAIFLIVTFILNNLNFLIATIVYTIISFITAAIVCLICRFFSTERRSGDCNCNVCRNRRSNESNSNELLTISSNCGNSNNGNLLTISSNGYNGNSNELLTINSDNNINNGNNNNNSCNCGCNSNNSANNGITARINVIPNSDTNGRSRMHIWKF